MVPFASLWLPVVLATVAVFFASFLLRMVSKHHWSDFSPLPDEESVRDSMRATGVTQGQYSFPFCSDSETMKSEAFLKSWAEGPTGFVVIWPKGPMAMGKSLGQWFLMALAVSAAAGWMASLVLPVGTDWRLVAKLTGMASFLAYGAGELLGPIWKGGSWAVCLKDLFDAAIYALATAGMFVWLWPGVA